MFIAACRLTVVFTVEKLRVHDALMHHVSHVLDDLGAYNADTDAVNTNTADDTCTYNVDTSTYKIDIYTCLKKKQKWSPRISFYMYM